MPSETRAALSRGDLAKALGEAGEQEYARLVRVLLAAQGMFALMPVASDFPVAARNALLERLAEDLSARGIAFHVAHLTRERWDVLQALAEIAPADGTPGVLAIVGLEETPGLVAEPGAPPGRPRALALLNHAREAVRVQFPFPLLVWCAPEAFVALQEHAPDFYDHFVGLAEFLYVGLRLPLYERSEVSSPERQDAMSAAFGPPESPAAVAFYAGLLARHPEPSHARVRALLGWAESLWGLRTADVNTRLTQALEATKEALTLLDADAIPEEVARGQVLTGLILSDLPTADRARSLRQAIACYEAALRVRTEEEFPVQWAMTQNNLGIAYQDLPTGDRGSNLQTAIACYEAAVRGYEAAGLTEETTQLRQHLVSLKQNILPKQGMRKYTAWIKQRLASLRQKTKV